MKLFILIPLIVIVFTPAYSQVLVDPTNTNNNLDQAILIENTRQKVIIYEELSQDSSKFYRVNANAGDIITIQILVPTKDKYFEYAPDVTIFDNRGFFRGYEYQQGFPSPIFYDESRNAFWYERQFIVLELPTQDHYFIEVSDNTNLSVIQDRGGKYAIVFGTQIDFPVAELLDIPRGFYDTQIFQENFAKLFLIFVGFALVLFLIVRKLKNG